jgi:predicted lipoprotein
MPMNRALVIVGAIVAVGVLSWFFPMFHVVSRSALREAKEQAAFHADEFVADFWTAQLTPALAEAADSAAVISTLRVSPDEARTQFGRTAGLGRSVLYFVRGSGKVVSVDKKTVGVALGNESGQADIALDIGLLFGNTVRDATGLLSGDDFPNSQQFNEISTELNRRIEADVLPQLREQAKIGATIEFVGCAEVTIVPRDVEPLRLVPLEVKVK